MFGDTFFVVNSSVMPDGKLQRQSHILNYHRTQETQAKAIIKFVYMNVNDKPANIFTNSCAFNTLFPLVEPILFQQDMDLLKERVVTKGSEDRLLTPPPISI